MCCCDLIRCGLICVVVVVCSCGVFRFVAVCVMCCVMLVRCVVSCCVVLIGVVCCL